MSTELTKCNNIWSYIHYRIPPSVVALFCTFSKIGFLISSNTFWIFQNFWIFHLFLKFWKIKKEVYDEITKPIFENLQKVDDRQTDIHDLCIYATRCRIKSCFLKRFALTMLKTFIVESLNCNEIGSIWDECGPQKIEPSFKVDRSSWPLRAFRLKF